MSLDLALFSDAEDRNSELYINKYRVILDFSFYVYMLVDMCISKGARAMIGQPRAEVQCAHADVLSASKMPPMSASA